MKEIKEVKFVTIGSKKDDPEVFVIRPAENQTGKTQATLAFKSAEDCVEYYNDLAARKIKLAEKLYQEAIEKAERELGGVKHFWEGSKGVVWWELKYPVLKQTSCPDIH